MTNILIPMAGAGSRFFQAGYIHPKPLILIDGKPMIQHVVENIGIEGNYIFIVQDDHAANYDLPNFFKSITPNSTYITIKGVTEGAACTTLLAKDLINNDTPLIIANSDQLVEGFNGEAFRNSLSHPSIEANIVTFKASDPKWSFVKLDHIGCVTEVAEKNPISNIATVGIYGWRKGSDYVRYAEQMIANNTRVNGEFYVCPVFNEAIKDNCRIVCHHIKKMWGLGTPEDLELYLQRNK